MNPKSTESATEDERVAEGYVYVVEYIDYDAYGHDGIFATEDAAVRSIQEPYMTPPYAVTWSQERASDGSLTVVGDFKARSGYSTKHIATWSVTKEEIRG